MEKERVVFWLEAGGEVPFEEAMRRELAEIAVGPGAPRSLPEVAVVIARWRDRSFDVASLDAEVASAAHQGPFCLRIQGFDDCGEGSSAPCEQPGETIAGTAASGAVVEILTRYQRLAPRRNAASSTPWFTRALAVHRAMHDPRKPLVVADLDHAIDTWQWALRLHPEAGAEVQLAALFHDIERLQSEADQRVEHLAPDYQAFKDAHARAGARAARDALAAASVPQPTRRRVAELVEAHERPSADPDLALLNDADALSFFSLNSWGFLRYYGLPHTARKVDYTLRRMGPAARARLFPVRYHPAVERLVRDALAEAPSAAREADRPSAAREAESKRDEI